MPRFADELIGSEGEPCTFFNHPASISDREGTILEVSKDGRYAAIKLPTGKIEYGVPYFAITLTLTEDQANARSR